MQGDIAANIYYVGDVVTTQNSYLCKKIHQLHLFILLYVWANTLFPWTINITLLVERLLLRYHIQYKQWSSFNCFSCMWPSLS